MPNSEPSGEKKVKQLGKLHRHKVKYESIRHDAAESKKIQDGLKELYRSIMESTHIGVTLIDPDYKILMTNNSVGEKFKKSVNEFIGKKCFQEFEKRQSICPHCPGKKAMETGKSTEVETEGVRDDGSHFSVRIQTFPIIKPDGTVTGFIEILEDITERKKAEEALRESEEKFRSLADQSPNMIFINKKGRIVYVNQKCEEVMGYNKEEFYSPDFDFLTLIAPESMGLIKESFAKHLRGEDVRPYDYSLIKKNGERIEAINTSKLIQYEGELAILGIVTDITERKRAEYSLRDNERFLHDIFNGIKDGISILDRDLNVIRVNKWMEHMYASEMPLVGKKCYKIYQRREFSCPCCPSIRTLETGEAHTEIVPYPSAEKRTGWIELSTFPLKGADGSITGVIEHVKDITKRKRAEQKLLEDQAQLKSLASQLSLTEESERHRLAMELHDQIGQSLVISKIKLDALCKSAPSDELTEDLKDVCNPLGTIIQDVSTLTFDLSFPVLYELGFEAAVAEWLSEQIQNKHGINTEFEDDGQFKPLDDDICVLLFRDVRELLVNVVKHANAQNVKVTINKVDDRIRVSVKDDGVGFDPVEVALKATERAEFGLFSIRQRLEQLGGRFEIESEPGIGSTITMTAPLKQEIVADET